MFADVFNANHSPYFNAIVSPGFMAYSLLNCPPAQLLWARQLRGIVMGSLLLGWLAGAPPRLAAQELVPGTYDSPTENLYNRPVAEEYRRQKVRTVLVMQQAPDRAAPDRPLVLRPVSYQEFDLQGRMCRQYWVAEGVLARRLDVTYGPADELTSAAGYRRLDDPADTTRLGRGWLPESATRYPATPGTGTAARWDRQTGDWQPHERFRQWRSHDTTYLATANARTGARSSLDRTYYAGPGQRQWRHDKLLFSETKLHEVEHEYVRFDKKRVLEIGRLDFQQDFIEYATAHPDDAAELTGKYPDLQLQDELARHAAGHPLPLVTQTFDAHGWALSRTAFGGRVVYQRNVRGQLNLNQHYRYDELWQLVRFAYLPNGLLARATIFDKQGQATGALFYSYGYY